jgi:2'-5' RNA ligase
MESQYFRTFIALPLQVKQPFIQARNKLMESLREERISWTDPDQYHVTLRFLGDTESSAIQGIGNALKDGLTVPAQTGLEISGLNSFGPRKRPRVIWVGFENSTFFEPLKQQVDHILKSYGIPSEEQPFRAHLTLGRIRRLKNLERYYLKIEEMNQYFQDSVLFDRLVFFRSILGSGRPEYQVLEQMQFSP